MSHAEKVCLQTKKYFLTLQRRWEEIHMSPYKTSAGATELRRDLLMPHALWWKAACLPLSCLTGLHPSHSTTFVFAIRPIILLLIWSTWAGWVIEACCRGEWYDERWIRRLNPPKTAWTHLVLLSGHQSTFHSHAQHGKIKNLQIQIGARPRSLAGASYVWFFQRIRTFGLMLLLWKWFGKSEPLLSPAVRCTCNEHITLVWEVPQKCRGLRKRGAWFISFLKASLY